jgi:hypothetical protein
MAPMLRRITPKWDLPHLHAHLQGVVDLEIWTIPYYMTALYSIRDPACHPYRLIQSAVYQEMLHAQLAANIANAYGLSPKFSAPVYAGQAVPHINFALDTPNPTTLFTPYSAELGPLDATRINTMCLIEYPEWDTERRPDMQENHEDYGSIGEFYAVVQAGMTELRADLRGGRNQVNELGPFYQNATELQVIHDGSQGLIEARRLIQIIVDQGEGQTQGVTDIPAEYQNTADGFRDGWPHFQKFQTIRALPELPATYTGVADPPPGSPGYQAQQRLIDDFKAFCGVLKALFSGQNPPAFGTLMAKVGGDILTCWQRNAIPRFS